MTHKFKLIFYDSERRIYTERFATYADCVKRVYALIGDIKPTDIFVYNSDDADVTHYFIENKDGGENV